MGHSKIHNSSKEVKEFLKQDYQECIFLAKILPYSPKLYAAEQVWKVIKRYILSSMVYKSLTQLKNFRILQY